MTAEDLYELEVKLMDKIKPISTRDDMIATFNHWIETASEDNKYPLRLYYNKVLYMWDRFGSRYFVPLQWLLLSLRPEKLNAWLDWVQESEGVYIKYEGKHNFNDHSVNNPIG